MPTKEQLTHYLEEAEARAERLETANAKLSAFKNGLDAEALAFSKCVTALEELQAENRSSGNLRASRHAYDLTGGFQPAQVERVLNSLAARFGYALHHEVVRQAIESVQGEVDTPELRELREMRARVESAMYPVRNA